MSTTVYQMFLSLLWALGATGIGWYTAMLTRQVSYVTLADGRRQERRLPLLFKMLLPLAPNIQVLFHKPVWTKLREKIKKQIVAAGFEGLIDETELLSLQFLLPILPGMIWVLFIRFALEATQMDLLIRLMPAFVLLGLIWLYTYPLTWLRREVQQRHHRIRRALPFALDLLTLSVEAGMDFMTALQRHCENSRIDALSEELIRVVREIQIGKTRREALRDMSIRVQLDDLRSIVNALVQADELGVSIGSIIRIQAEQIRTRRFEQAEKLANEAPVKMLGPLVFFIFPSVFLILMGPVVFRLIQHGI